MFPGMVRVMTWLDWGWATVMVAWDGRGLIDAVVVIDRAIS